MAATKTVQIVIQTWRNRITGEMQQVHWNVDDGALAGYTGPGPDWEMVSQDGASDTVPDYTDYRVFSSVYGAALADQAVASGQIKPPTLATSPAASPGNVLFSGSTTTTPAAAKVAQVVAVPVPKFLRWAGLAGLAYGAYRLFL